MFPQGETVELLEGVPVLNPYSGEIDRYEWTDATVVETWTGVGVASRPASESLDTMRNPSYSGITVFGVPPTSRVNARHRVRWAGKTYFVDGEPGDFRNPLTGWNPGRVVNAERVEG